MWLSSAATARIEDGAQRGDRVAMGTVVDVHAPAVGPDETCSPKLAQMMANGGFGQAQGGGQLAAICLIFTRGEQQRHDLDPGWVCQRLEAECNLQGIVVAHWAGSNGCAADRRGDVDRRQRLGHRTILPDRLTYIKKVAFCGMFG